MNNIRHLFCNDLKRITSNVVTGIIVLGLVFLPSIFSWYNIIACWNVFDNTGNLTVAVANVDEGYESDLVPIKVDIGEQVVSALRANDQLNWKFTTEEDAVDGARSGKYYAAVVIPESFSRDMMTFYSDDVQHAEIVYYTNEKKSAVAPKVTGQGADQVSYQVNKVFTKTLSELALGISSAFYRYADTSGANGRIAVLSNHVATMSTQMSQASAVLATYSSLLGSAQSLIDGSAQLLAQAQGSADGVGESAAQSATAVTSVSEAMRSSSEALSQALKKSSEGYAGVADAINAAHTATGQVSADSSRQMRDQAATVDANVAQYQSIVAQLQHLEAQVDDQYKPAIENMISQMNASIQMQQHLSSSMVKAADDIDAGNADAQSDYAEAEALAVQAQQSVSGISADYDNDVKPATDELIRQVSDAVDALDSTAAMIDSASSDLQGSAGSVSDQMGTTRQKIDESATDLSVSAQKLSALSTAISQALSSGDVQALRHILSNDPDTLASVFAAPVQLNRVAVFPAENFGSQMAPLYTTLALWIGSLLLVVAVKVTVSEKARDELDEPKLYQLFLGRFGVFALLSLCQATVMALGNMLFLGVQVNDPVLYMICFWLAGLVFTFFIYAMVVSFANLGKAIAVFLLIIQVTAGGGSFPLQVLPDFFQVLSPYLPATHVINAMRAAMMGVYMNDFWVEIGYLMLFLIPAALLGLVLRKPLMRFLEWFVSKVEDSKLAA